jgi:hypothetical protein
MRESGIAKGGQPFDWGFGSWAPDLLSPFLPPKAAKNDLATALIYDVQHS